MPPLKSLHLESALIRQNPFISLNFPKLYFIQNEPQEKDLQTMQT